MWIFEWGSFWFVCTIIALILVIVRRLGVEYFILSLFLGPLVLLIILLSSKEKKVRPEDQILSELRELRQRVYRLESFIEQKEDFKDEAVKPRPVGLSKPEV